jgi:hypothetical protein
MRAGFGKQVYTIALAMMRAIPARAWFIQALFEQQEGDQ